MALVSIFVRNYRFRWAFPVLLFLTLILLGYSFVEIIDYKLYINDISRIGNDPECYFARLSECPSVNEKSLKVTLNVFAFAENDSVESINSKIIAYFEKC